MISDEAKKRWLAKASEITPKINRYEMHPLTTGKVNQSSKSFFGWEYIADSKLEEGQLIGFEKSNEIILSFGEHIVGYFNFDVELIGPSAGGPLRVKFIFGEIPSEIAEPFDPYTGSLSRAWLQDEIITLEQLPQTVKLTRRYAFQYVKIVIEAISFDYQIRLKNIKCDCVTSADPHIEKYLLKTLSTDLQIYDEVSLRTLKNTMFETFEDGPKRDKRLWLGDFALLAGTNYLTFNNFDLVKKCLYLFASKIKDDGRMPACIYTKPTVHTGTEYIVDFAIKFGYFLLEYFEATNDFETVNDLWDAAFRQAEIILENFDRDGQFINKNDWWIFVDWCPELQKDCALQAIIIFNMKKLIKLGKVLNKNNELEILNNAVKKISAYSINKYYDKDLELFISGGERQISWASQIWMVAAEVFDTNQSKMILNNLFNKAEAVKPVTPFIYHYTLEVLFKCGMKDKALELLREFWGGMIENGANTFWEVYDKSNPKFSPYGNYLINSYCHSWSSTPAYFFRKYIK
jgi:alpha-L-rhamnosidase